MSSIPQILLPQLPASESPLLWLVGDRVCAGFPSPALDFPGERIDLLKLLVTHPPATFYLRVSGESMRDAGIFDGDILVVNRARRPRHGHIVVAAVDGEFTVKTLYQLHGRTKLRAANPTFPDIVPGDNQTIQVIGVVTSSIKIFKV